MRNKPAKAETTSAGTGSITASTPIADAPTFDSPALVEQAPIINKVPPRGKAKVPAPIRYKIATLGTIMYRGVRVTLKQGKVIDERCYDIAFLREQGVELIPVTE